MRYYIYHLTPVDNYWEDLGKSKELPKEIDEAARTIGWEGEIILSGTFMLPVEQEFVIGYAWQQSNNGSTFIASPIPLKFEEVVDSTKVDVFAPGEKEESEAARRDLEEKLRSI
jgi:hypothetical protein